MSDRGDPGVRRTEPSAAADEGYPLAPAAGEEGTVGAVMEPGNGTVPPEGDPTVTPDTPLVAARAVMERRGLEEMAVVSQGARVGTLKRR